MEALDHIGWEKAVRFIWTSLYCWLLHLSFIPQIRALLLTLVGAKIGKDTIIMDVDFTNAYHYGFGKLAIGQRCFLGDGVMIDLRGGVHLGDDVTVSNRTSIVTHINVGYKHHPLQRQYPTKESPVMVDAGSYIGTGAILLPGVSIGRRAVVAAGAVVTRDVPAKTVVGGVPARAIKRIKNHESRIMGKTKKS